MAGHTGGAWIDNLVASGPKVDHAVEGVGFVDLSTGELVTANPTLRELLGFDGALPIPLEVFVGDGWIARPDIDALLTRAASRDHREAWGATVRVHRADGVTVDLDLRCAVVDQVTGPGRALQLLAQLPERVAGRARFGVPPSAPAAFCDLYDSDVCLVATDPRLVEYGVDPAAELGMLTLVIVHPDDQAGVYEAVSRVVHQHAPTAEYTIRILGPAGLYVPINVHLVRMVGHGELRLVAAVRPISTIRRPLPEERLTERECQVVHALFGGWRVPALAVRDGVSTKTIRNQLSVIYKKLDVTSQSEMLMRFFPPSSRRAERIDAVLDPNWSDDPVTSR